MEEAQQRKKEAKLKRELEDQEQEARIVREREEIKRMEQEERERLDKKTRDANERERIYIEGQLKQTQLLDDEKMKTKRRLTSVVEQSENFSHTRK